MSAATQQTRLRAKGRMLQAKCREPLACFNVVLTVGVDKRNAVWTSETHVMMYNTGFRV